ncbi:MAG: SnoaL-like domain-containing protein [Nitrospira sp.]|nr:SnoaL-like domain-containing protein [Nitrospira sp.]
MVHKQTTQLRDFAVRYTAAWCSRDAPTVAQFYAPDGSLTINGGTPSVGRSAIATAAQGFFTAFPDLMVYLNDLVARQDKIIYQWALEGTHSRTGQRVHISGFEEWRMGDDGLIAESLGSFDAADLERQIENGVDRK